MNHLIKIVGAGVSSVLIFLFAFAAGADTVSLRWEGGTSTPSGFQIYTSEVPGSFLGTPISLSESSIPFGNNEYAYILNVSSTATTYIAISAYDSNGFEGPLSAMLSYSPTTGGSSIGGDEPPPPVVDPPIDPPIDPPTDTDSDGDGVLDSEDAFPNDPGEWSDSDGDGVGDNGDVFPNDPGEWSDSDGDGVGDNADAFPGDASETADSDGDGVGDNADAFPSDPSETTDSDGDGVGDNADAFPNDPGEWETPINSYSINIGGSAFTDSQGQAWETDGAYVTGGVPKDTTSTISGTVEQALFQTNRWHDLSLGTDMVVRLPISNGDYTVKLHFADIYSGYADGADHTGQRMFDILVEGAELLTAYDVFAEAGDALAAATATLTTTVSDGVLEITIQHNVGGSILNGVEVSAGTGTPPPSEPLGTPGQPYIDD